MPPRKNSGQSTLAFGSGSKNRVSKSTRKGADTKKPHSKAIECVDNKQRIEKPNAVGEEAPSSAAAQTTESPEPVIAASSNSSSLVEHQERLAARRSKTDIDRRAETLKEADIHEYWNKICQARMSQAVHQEELSLYEKILRHFDLSSRYGPCIGIARITRWRRAYALNLSPPLEVLAILLHENWKKQTQSVANMDVLMS